MFGQIQPKSTVFHSVEQWQKTALFASFAAGPFPFSSGLIALCPTTQKFLHYFSEKSLINQAFIFFM
jgi:hypothetical protein